jgi:hypothetical protein
MAYNNRGMILHAQQHLDEAMASFRQAVTLRPNLAEAYNNMAAVLLQQARPEEALTCLDQALRLQPKYASPHITRAMCLLNLGQFQAGWEEYEWRRSIPEFTVPALPGPQPAWDGSALQGRTILVRAEQGLGDTLQFIRLARVLQQRGGHVVVEAQTQLVSLLRTCPGIDLVYSQGENPPAFDVHVLLMSLPRLLHIDLASIPAEVPYLTANRDLEEAWRKELETISGFKVGIVWQGNPGPLPDYLRSVPVQVFAPLAQVGGVHLFSLQVGVGREQLAALNGQFPVTDLGSRFKLESFDDAAAVLKNLNLLVTVDTALAHLAGALGVPVWVALPLGCDWRWLRERDDSPWYPNMRLFRQKAPAAWDDVFARIATALRGLAG